jgi:glycosyltransferase involved in cell wall biosynthesis
MVGVDPALPGGISAVVRCYRDHGLFARWPVRYLVSYRGRPLALQARVMTIAGARLTAALLRREVALLHVHSASRGSFWRKSSFCAAAWLFRVPFLFHLHSGEFDNFYRQECHALGRWWIRWILRRAAAVAVLSPGWLDVVRAIEPSARVSVLPNPVSIPVRPSDVAAECRRVLFLGRLRRGKGVFDLLDALPTLLERHPQLRVCIAGDGELDAVHRHARQAGVDGAIELPGWIEGAAKDRELARADILVLPSYHEGLPLCVLEAMAQGVPVVATRVGGIPDALDDGACGVLVEPGRVDQLAAALTALADDPAHRRRLAQAARVRATEMFGAPGVCAAVSRLWTACLGSPARASAWPWSRRGGQ